MYSRRPRASSTIYIERHDSNFVRWERSPSIYNYNTAETAVSTKMIRFSYLIFSAEGEIYWKTPEGIKLITEEGGACWNNDYGVLTIPLSYKGYVKGNIGILVPENQARFIERIVCDYNEKVRSGRIHYSDHDYYRMVDETYFQETYKNPLRNNVISDTLFKLEEDEEEDYI